MWRTNSALKDHWTYNNVQRVHGVYNSNHRLNMRIVTSEIGNTTVNSIIAENLAMQKICAKLAPKILRTTNSGDECLIMHTFCNAMKKTLACDVIAGDESWIFEYDLETRRFYVWVKTMLMVLQIYTRGADSEWYFFYLVVLRMLKRRFNRMSPAIAGNWKMHHHNAPSHTSFVVTDLPDLAPTNYFLFSKVKFSLKGHHHGILSAVKEFLRTF